MARSRVVARRGGNQRLTEWTSSADITDFTQLAAATAVLDSSLTQTEPMTMVRTRGSICVLSDQTAQSERPFGAYGIAVVSDQASAAGVASLPTPMADAVSDLWFVHGFFYAPMNTGTGSPVEVNNVSQTFEFDSKAMRRLSSDQTMVVVVENASASHGLFFAINFRMLLKFS